MHLRRSWRRSTSRARQSGRCSTRCGTSEEDDFDAGGDGRGVDGFYAEGGRGGGEIREGAVPCWHWLARLTPSGQSLTWCGASREDVFHTRSGRRAAGRRGRPMLTTVGSSHRAWALTGTVLTSQVVVSGVWSRRG
eukprot:357298-Chlamydomonas_euryale.AAC.4